MASYLVQGGSSLYRMTQAGVATALTLPVGTTLYGSTQPCRAALYQVENIPLIVVVNGGTHDFYIDTYGVVRPLQIAAPISTPTPVAGTGTGLTGVYRVACTYKVKDSNGVTLIESGMGPISAATAALANKTLAISVVPVSGNVTVNARGLYRTVAGGTTLYPWFDIDDNTTLTEERGIADSLLSILPTTAIRFGAPPDLKLIASWKNRLWGVPRATPDLVNWTEDRNFYGWSADNQLVVPPRNTDPYGVTALIPRRDDLGLGRRRGLFAMRGSSNTSFQRVGISESIGPINQESVVVIYNTAYFLTEIGVAEWTDQGVGYISQAQVDGWFTTDTYFNRAMFPYAQGRYNPDTDAYELLLASVGSSTLNRWVAFDLSQRCWFGPHKTDAFTPSCTGNTSTLKGIFRDTNGFPITVMGGTDGFLYKRDVTTVTDSGTAVAFSVALPPLSAGQPDLEKVFGQWTIHTRAESTGLLTTTPTVGTLEASASAPQYHDLTKDRERMPRLGKGRYAQLTLSHSATTERPRIYGIEMPVVSVGRR